MIGLEILALVLVAAYTVLRARFGPEPRRFLSRAALLVVASWVAEDTVIIAYGFYRYSPLWTIFVHRVPLAVILIWPCVIHSQWDICRYLLRHRDEPGGRGAAWWPVPAAGAALVLCDASLIEPIAVQAGLWEWTRPGFFDVPPIGIIGWALFAGLCLLLLERSERRGGSVWQGAAVILVAPVGTHGLLLGLWWGALRWVSTELSPWPFVVLAWALSLALTAAAVRTRAKERVPPAEMWIRVPATLYFLVLLFVFGRHELALVLYAFAFAPPYIALTRWPVSLRRAWLGLSPDV